MDKQSRDLEEKPLSGLEGTLGSMVAGSLAFLQSYTTYELMRKAGVYGDNGFTIADPYLYYLGVASNTLAVSSLLICGFYVGSKIGRFISSVPFSDR